MTLSASILEVNNTFGERHMYFLERPGHQISEQKAGNLDRALQHTAAQTDFVKNWEKEFHVSPFNDRSGTYSVKFVDPFDINRGQHIKIMITLTTPDGFTKLIASIQSMNGGIKSSLLESPIQRAWFLVSYGWIGFLTIPRIFYQAGKLYFGKRLMVWNCPKPLPGTICRHANDTEKLFEFLFRQYLQAAVAEAKMPIRVQYQPAGITGTSVLQIEPHSTPCQSEKWPHVIVRIIDPEMYTLLTMNHYSDHLCLLKSLCASPFAEVTNTDAFIRAFQEKNVTPAENTRTFWALQLMFHLLSWFRRRTKPSTDPKNSDQRISVLDQYVLSASPVKLQFQYGINVLLIFISRYFAFGSMRILRIEILILLGMLFWVTFRMA